ncbi:hypothetical protein FQN57_006956 [Myotisia sp. PD_48]|nr:hypothetical protein FQN57_006956 [Myotisia sp. PD_48]
MNYVRYGPKCGVSPRTLEFNLTEKWMVLIRSTAAIVNGQLVMRYEKSVLYRRKNPVDRHSAFLAFMSPHWDGNYQYATTYQRKNTRNTTNAGHADWSCFIDLTHCPTLGEMRISAFVNLGECMIPFEKQRELAMNCNEQSMDSKRPEFSVYEKHFEDNSPFDALITTFKKDSTEP